MHNSHTTSLNRRDLLACIPAFIAAPLAIAQASAPPKDAAGQAPKVFPRTGKPAAQEGLTLPFAMAGCWADDYGMLSNIRLLSRLDCSISVRAAKSPMTDDQLFVQFLSVGASIECMGMLAAASMAGIGIYYPKLEEGGDLVKVAIRLGQVRKQPSREVVQSALAIFARPDPRGAFDAKWKPTPEQQEKMRISMIDQGFTCVLIQEDKRKEFMRAIESLSKTSPAFAAAVGPLEMWGAGSTPYLVGLGSGSTVQTLLNVGRGMQKAGLFASQFGASLDAHMLLPTVFESAASQGAEQTAAAQTLSAMLAAPGFEPMAICRLGTLMKPQPRGTPPALEMLSISFDAPVANTPA